MPYVQSCRHALNDDDNKGIQFLAVMAGDYIQPHELWTCTSEAWVTSRMRLAFAKLVDVWACAGRQHAVLASHHNQDRIYFQVLQAAGSMWLGAQTWS